MRNLLLLSVLLCTFGLSSRSHASRSCEYLFKGETAEYGNVFRRHSLTYDFGRSPDLTNHFVKVESIKYLQVKERAEGTIVSQGIDFIILKTLDGNEIRMTTPENGKLKITLPLNAFKTERARLTVSMVGLGFAKYSVYVGSRLVDQAEGYVHGYAYSKPSRVISEFNIVDSQSLRPPRTLIVPEGGHVEVERDVPLFGKRAYIFGLTDFLNTRVRVQKYQDYQGFFAALSDSNMYDIKKTTDVKGIVIEQGPDSIVVKTDDGRSVFVSGSDLRVTPLGF